MLIAQIQMLFKARKSYLPLENKPNKIKSLKTLKNNIFQRRNHPYIQLKNQEELQVMQVLLI